MTSASPIRARGPASVLLTILLLAVAYWTGALPSNSTDNSPDRSRTDSSQSATDSTSRQKTDAGRATDSVQTTDSGRSNGADVGTSEDSSQADLHYGLLRQVSSRDYLSPAGLIYGPGSQEGHRLEHLRRHTVDDPGRSGPHGVFDGGMEGALKTIDLAYEQANAGQRTTRQVEDDRIIYTVDLGKRVGYVGGREGQRRRHPMARRVRLVLDGNRVVTAFPL